MSDDAHAMAAGLLEQARERIDTQLAWWAERLRYEVGGRDGDAIAYALLSPGKRVRAALVLEAYRACGGATRAIDGVAAAVETVHAYSLVHDDLPCMDDDDLRRGRLTTHREFDVPTATRVGFRLVPVAGRVLAHAARALDLDTAALGLMARTLFQAGGVEGMVGGQWRDLEAEQRELDLDELRAVHRGKTGALIRASCLLGGIAAGAGPAQLRAVADYGAEIGLAFQIADDVLDATETSDTLGKTAGKDAVLQKSTYVRHLGVEGARKEADGLSDRAIAHLVSGGVVSPALGSLARYIVERRH